MIIREKQIQAEQKEIFKKLLNKSRKCQADGCKEEAINSHVLSKSKILKPLSLSDGHLYEVSSNNIKYKHRKRNFVKTGIKEILSFKCFCQPHDNKIFDSIENQDFDLYEEKNQILLLVRAVFFEKYKKELYVDYFPILSKEEYTIAPQSYINSLVFNYKLGVRDMSYCIENLNKQFYDKAKNYIFYTFKVPKVEVAMSGVFNVEKDEDIMFTKTGQVKYTAPNSIIVTFFPLNGFSYFICGFEVKYLENLKFINWMKNEEKRMKVISDIMVERLETWAVSSDFYECYLKDREDIFFQEFSRTPNSFLKGSSSKFNIFSKN